MKTGMLWSVMLVVLVNCSFKNERTFDLSNSTWKFCDDKNTGGFSDVLVFSEHYLFLKSDTVFMRTNDSAVGLIDRVDYEYADRKLYLKDFKGNIGRYCEK